MATKVPPAERASSTARAICCTAAKRGWSASGGRSRRVSVWAAGTARTWPVERGRRSRKAVTPGARWTVEAGAAPATMAQKGQGAAISGHEDDAADHRLAGEALLGGAGFGEG